jgi:hypothetical protein
MFSFPTIVVSTCFHDILLQLSYILKKKLKIKKRKKTKQNKKAEQLTNIVSKTNDTTIVGNENIFVVHNI